MPSLGYPARCGLVTLYDVTTWNRLASPLPDSVIDRFLAEHPDEINPRARRRRPTAAADDRQTGALGPDEPVNRDRQET